MDAIAEPTHTTAGSRLDHLLKGMVNKVAWVAIACTLLILLSTCVNAFMRRLLHLPISGVVEYNEGLLIGMVFCALPLTQLEKRHVAVEFVADYFPSKAQRYIQAFAALVSLGTFVILLVGSTMIAVSSTLGREALPGAIRMPIWPLRWFIPIGSFFILFVLLRQVITSVVSRRGTGGRR